MTGWKGVDLDGTLAEYTVFKGIDHIGVPIPAMVARVKAWLAAGDDVRIFTARVSDAARVINAGDNPTLHVETVVSHIDAWCLEHLGQVLPVTCVKDYDMLELWDDRCVQVLTNTGVTLESQVQAVLAYADAYFRNPLARGYSPDVHYHAIRALFGIKPKEEQ